MSNYLQLRLSQHNGHKFEWKGIIERKKLNVKFKNGDKRKSEKLRMGESKVSVERGVKYFGK